MFKTLRLFNISMFQREDPTCQEGRRRQKQGGEDRPGAERQDAGGEERHHWEHPKEIGWSSCSQGTAQGTLTHRERHGPSSGISNGIWSSSLLKAFSMGFWSWSISNCFTVGQDVQRISGPFWPRHLRIRRWQQLGCYVNVCFAAQNPGMISEQWGDSGLTLHSLGHVIESQFQSNNCVRGIPLPDCAFALIPKDLKTSQESERRKVGVSVKV